MDCEVTSMRNVLRILIATLSLLSACTQTEGQCWYDGPNNGNIGAGGGPIVSGGGGFGDAPPKPQDAANPVPPDCEMVPDTHCNEKCLADYESAAAKCGGIDDDGQRKTCQDAAFASYKSCRNYCQSTQGQWDDKCWDDYQDDNNACGKMKDGPEKAKCRQVAGERYGDCKQKCKNQ
jgi:hypothetical protein